VFWQQNNPDNNNNRRQCAIRGWWLCTITGVYLQQSDYSLLP